MRGRCELKKMDFSRGTGCRGRGHHFGRDTLIGWISPSTNVDSSSMYFAALQNFAGPKGVKVQEYFALSGPASQTQHGFQGRERRQARKEAGNRQRAPRARAVAARSVAREGRRNFSRRTVPSSDERTDNGSGGDDDKTNKEGRGRLWAVTQFAAEERRRKSDHSHCHSPPLPVHLSRRQRWTRDLY